MRRTHISYLVIAFVVMLFGLQFFFPGEFYFFHRFVVQKNCGCGFIEAVRSIRRSASEVRDRERLQKTSAILARDQSGYLLWNTRDGKFWAPAHDDSLFWVLAEMAQEPYGGDESLKNATVLDCGAHLGTFSKRALLAGASLVVAIEPGPKQIESLRRTFSKEIGEGRLLVYPKGVWNTTTTLRLTAGDITATETTIDPHSVSPDTNVGPTVEIPVTTIDALVDELKLARVDFIKMDIEGAEAPALTGARETLARFKPRMAIAAYHKHDDSLTIPATIRRANATYRQATLGCRLDLEHSHPLTFFFY